MDNPSDLSAFRRGCLYDFRSIVTPDAGMHKRRRASVGAEQGGELAAQLGQLGRDQGGAIGLLGMAGEKLLVLRFRRPEGLGGEHLRHDGRRKNRLGLEPLHDLLGHPALGFGLAEDHRTVLAAPVMPLAVGRGGVVGGEEHQQQLGKADLLRVELEAHHLRVAGPARTHLVIAGCRQLAAAVAGFHPGHAAQGGKHRLGTPEAATTQSDGF